MLNGTVLDGGELRLFLSCLDMEGWCFFSVFKMTFSKMLKRRHLLRIARTPCGCVCGMSKREWSASDQMQRHGDEASKKRSGLLIADMGHHHEVICTVRLSNCEPVDKDDDDQKLPTRQEVPCA